MQKHADCQSILFDEQTIQTRLAEIALALDELYKDKTPLVLCPLKGSIMFCADIIRKMKTEINLDFIKISSYGNSATSGQLQIKQPPTAEIKNKDVLILEDIMDSGKTLYFLRAYLLEQGARDVKIVTLLDKPARREFPIKPDYFGFEIEDEFIIGYGLDYAEKYRNLPYVGILKRSVYEK